MKLTELDAMFVRREVRDGREYYEPVDDIASADGVLFQCPKCFATNNGPVGTHSILCWQPRIPPDVDPKPGRWSFVGTSLADLSLVAGSSSVLLTGGCNAHFFVRNGAIEGC